MTFEDIKFGEVYCFKWFHSDVLFFNVFDSYTEDNTYIEGNCIFTTANPTTPSKGKISFSAMSFKDLTFCCSVGDANTMNKAKRRHPELFV